MWPKRFAKVFAEFAHDLRGSARLTADTRSFLRLGLDFALARLLWLIPSLLNGLREIRLRGDIRISYRLNRGDLHSIREIWFQEAYWLPFDPPEGVLLDLGANIGMASVWLAKRFSFTEVISVEPDPQNAALVGHNLELNEIKRRVVQAAIGPREGTAKFAFSEVSNLGKLDPNGSPVLMTSVDAILKTFTVNRFSLIKIDIEGGERDLFQAPANWLECTDSIIIEFHDTVDCSRVSELVKSKGFKYIPAHSLPGDNMDCFLRKETCAPESQRMSGTKRL